MMDDVVAILGLMMVVVVVVVVFRGLLGLLSSGVVGKESSIPLGLHLEDSSLAVETWMFPVAFPPTTEKFEFPNLGWCLLNIKGIWVRQGW